MTPEQIAARINQVRADEGLPAIDAAVGQGGEIVSGASRQGAAAREVAPMAAKPAHKPGANRDVKAAILRLLRSRRRAMSVAAVAEVVESDPGYVRDRLLRLEVEGKVERGPNVAPTRATRGGGRSAMTFQARAVS